MANIQEERHLELFDKMDFDAYSKKRLDII